MALPIHTYGSEIGLHKKNRGKNETAEMKYLRNVAGYTRKDRMRDNEVGEK
jgi:hypothetical protein